MRWKYPQQGDTRVRYKFCLFPLSWDGTNYWLETVVLTEQFAYYYPDGYYWKIIDLTLPAV